MRYFVEQGVELRVISGDDPRTVSAIAARAGVPDADLCVDASTLDTDEKVHEASRRYRVFGRVTPQQKRELVRALHDRMPRTRVFVFAALFAIAVIGGAALAITHPWDPTLYKTSATTPADTSSAGFPGTLTTLTGQDSSSETTSSSTDAVYQAILADYTTLGELEAKLDACTTVSSSRAVVAFSAASTSAFARRPGWR